MSSTVVENKDQKTADAFASSWNNLPGGSVYSYDQIVDWFEPITDKDIEGKTVLELGCGNGSLMCQIVKWNPEKLDGVDLGDSVYSCQQNLKEVGANNATVIKHDLTTFKSDGYDVVYSIGVLHHIKEPLDGLKSVIKNTKSGGKFHCWVYAHEGNLVIRLLVEPLRRIASKLPWWITKYLIATPASFVYFLYAHFVVLLRLSFMPLYEYSKWITKRGFLFFRHVAFDQLVTPQTVYIKKSTIEGWLDSFDDIDKESTYCIFRNGNSWKFGGRKK